MTLSTYSQHISSPGRLVGGTLLGSLLVGAGMVMAYLTIATPFVRSLVPAGSSNGGGAGLALAAWSVTSIAAGAMLVAGASRLARIAAVLRRGGRSGGPASRALAARSDEVVVAADVALNDGAPIPELALGAFGAVVVHTLPAANRIRRGSAGWEARTGDGWRPTEDPLERATRDADRVRRWLVSADLDFVVRVYAAILVSDSSIGRSPGCAAVSAEQLPQWIASLPRQRSLTTARRGRLLALARAVGRRPHQSGRDA